MDSVYLIVPIIITLLGAKIISSYFYLVTPSGVSLEQLFGKEWQRDQSQPKANRFPYVGTYKGKKVNILTGQIDDIDYQSGQSYNAIISMACTASDIDVCFKKKDKLSLVEKKLGFVDFITQDPDFDTKWTIGAKSVEMAQNVFTKNVISLIMSAEKDISGTIKIENNKIIYKYSGILYGSALTFHLRDMCDFLVKLSNTVGIKFAMTEMNKPN